MTPRTSRVLPKAKVSGFKPKPLSAFDKSIVENWLENFPVAQEAFFDRVRVAAIEKGVDPGPLLTAAENAIENYMERTLSPISIPIEIHAFMSTHRLK